RARCGAVLGRDRLGPEAEARANRLGDVGWFSEEEWVDLLRTRSALVGVSRGRFGDLLRRGRGEIAGRIGEARDEGPCSDEIGNRGGRVRGLEFLISLSKKSFYFLPFLPESPP